MPALQSARRAARRVRGAARRAVSPEHGSSQCSKRTPRTRTPRATPCTWTPPIPSLPQLLRHKRGAHSRRRALRAESEQRAAESEQRAAERRDDPRRAPRSHYAGSQVPPPAVLLLLRCAPAASCYSHMQLRAFTYTQRSETRSPSRRAGLSARFAQWDWSASAPFAPPTRSS